MQIISGTTQFQIMDRTAVAIGKFDGIHRGHRLLLESLLEAGGKGLKTAVFTFDPPPGVFFGGRQALELTTRFEKRELFERMGIDILIEFPLNRKTAAMPPEDFITAVLAERLRTAFIAAGADVSYGDGGRGDYRLLESMAGRCGYQVEIIGKVEYEGREISSSYVREEVAAGHMELVEELLGAPYCIMGEVMHGRALGRTIGMPTVNLLPPPDKLLPPKGVYLSEVLYEGSRYKGITNVGCKPTVNSGSQMGVETYLYDFAQDIYGKMIEVNLKHFRRPERKFSGVEELKENMARDIEAGRCYWRLHE